MCTGFHTPVNTSCLTWRRFNPRKTVNPGQKEGSLMIDTKVVLGLVILLGTLITVGQPPAGGVPIPQSGVSSAQ
jgi:hypothetical protein